MAGRQAAPPEQQPAGAEWLLARAVGVHDEGLTGMPEEDPRAVRPPGRLGAPVVGMTSDHGAGTAGDRAGQPLTTPVRPDLVDRADGLAEALEPG